MFVQWIKANAETDLQIYVYAETGRITIDTMR